MPILDGVPQDTRGLSLPPTADSQIPVRHHDELPKGMSSIRALFAQVHHRSSLVAGALATLVITATTGLGIRAVSDPSPWLHLRIGQYLLAGGRFGFPDPWAPFATRAYVPTEWLPAVVGYLTFEQFGLPGIAWLRGAGILVFLTALAWTTRLVAGGAVAVVVAFAALLGAYDGLTERPQMLSLIFLALTLGAWWRTASDLRARWWLVPLTWLWACSHGLWLIGIGVGFLIVIGLLLDRRVNRGQSLRLLSVPLVSLAAAALTPIGPKLLLAPFTVGNNARVFVGEWQSPTVRQPVTVITLTLIGLVMLLWTRSSVRPQWWQLGLLTASLLSSLLMARTVAVGAVLVAPLLAQELQRLTGARHTQVTRRVCIRWMGAVLVALVAAGPLAAAVAEKPLGVPSRLSSQLTTLPKNTLIIAEGDITGWLLWTAPNLRPVEDVRIEVYSPVHIQRFVETMAVGPRWHQFIDETKVSTALLLKGSPLATALQERAGWRAAGSDAGYLLLRKP